MTNERHTFEIEDVFIPAATGNADNDNKGREHMATVLRRMREAMAAAEAVESAQTIDTPTKER